MNSIYNYATKLELRKDVLNTFVGNLTDHKLVQTLKLEQKVIDDVLYNLYYALTETMLKSKTSIRLSEIIFGNKNILNILKTPEDYTVSSEIDKSLFKALFLYETDLVCKAKNGNYFIFRLNNLADWIDANSLNCIGEQ